MSFELPGLRAGRPQRGLALSRAVTCAQGLGGLNFFVERNMAGISSIRDRKQRKRRRAARTLADFVRAAREVVEAFGRAYDGAAR
jgi:hypothetical protein